MASVTFLASIGGDGSTVADTTDPSVGLAGGGHKTRFVPALAQVVAIGAFLVARVQDAANYAAAALGYRDAAANSASLAAGYAAALGANTSGVGATQSPRNYQLGTSAYLNQTWLYASATYDPASIAAGASLTTTVNVPGAEMGDFAHASRSVDSTLTVNARVSAAGVVTLTYFNPTAGAVDQASHTVYVAVMKRIPQ